MIVEVEAARLAAERRTEDDLVALDGAMAARRAASSWGDAEFVDADIALHRAVVAAAHNPVLTDLFAEFAPALRQGLIDLVDLLDLRTAHPGHGEDTHAALVRAVVAGDAQEAARTARAELEATLGMLRGA